MKIVKFRVRDGNISAIGEVNMDTKEVISIGPEFKFMRGWTTEGVKSYCKGVGFTLEKVSEKEEPDSK